ncbi:MAG TPA: hypothetical protein VNZ03_34400 [Terriglobales bacterium]|nr:hypothetical protein [Terriglobales bacterium]
MKNKVCNSILCVALIVCGAVWGSAQEKSKSDVRTITGCLSNGDSAKEFLLTGTDGSTWEIRSSAVNLAHHVGHTVEATGVVSNSAMHNMKEDTKDMAKDSGMKKDNTEHGHLKVTDLKMVSESCK